MWRSEHGADRSTSLPASAPRRARRRSARELLPRPCDCLVHLLLEHDLVDELRLLIYPVVLGNGKRLFAKGAAPRSLQLAKSVVSPNGVIIVTYERGGAVNTGSFALKEPTPAEIERRRNLK